MRAEDRQRLIALAGRRVTRVTGVAGVTPPSAHHEETLTAGVTGQASVTPPLEAGGSPTVEEKIGAVTPVTPVTRVTDAGGVFVGAEGVIEQGANQATLPNRSRLFDAARSGERVGPQRGGLVGPPVLRTHRSAPLWAPEDWRGYFDERAAIREFDGRTARSDAERLALDDTVEHWLAVHPLPPSDPNHGCALCGGRDRTRNSLLPQLAQGGHVWIHQECWPALREKRRAAALQSLRDKGLSGLIEPAPQGAPL